MMENSFNAYDDLFEAMASLQKRGFDKTFKIVNNLIYCLQSGEIYPLEALSIVEYHRFKGIDKQNIYNRIIFVLVTKSGESGYIVSSENINKKMSLLGLMDKVKILKSYQFH